MSKFIHINSVMRVNLANLNSSEGGSNQITLKKITAFNGEEFVYVSGQAYRRYLRETIYWLTDAEFEICGIDKNGSPIIYKNDTEGQKSLLISDKKVTLEEKTLARFLLDWCKDELDAKEILIVEEVIQTGKAPTDSDKKKKEEKQKIWKEICKKLYYHALMRYIIQHYSELDVFGFLLPVSEKQIGTLRKTSPFQTSALISSFPYRYNTDMLTRSKAEEMGGDIVKVEIDTFNYLQGTQIINAEMVGAYWDEHNEKAVSVVDNKERNKRINWLLSALQNTMGGSKKARLLNDFSPVLVVATLQKTGVPYFSHRFEISPPGKNIKAQSFKDVKGALDLKSFLDTFDSAKPYLDKVYFGFESSAFLNGDEIKELINSIDNIEVCENPREVFDKLKEEFPETSN